MYMITRTNIINMFRAIRSYITDISEIEVIDKYGHRRGVSLLYHIIYMIQSIINKLNGLIDYFDIDIEKIQCITENNNGMTTLILEEKNARKLNLRSLVNYFNDLNDHNDPNYNHSDYNDMDTIYGNAPVFYKFEIKTDNDTVCLKNQILKYYDPPQQYDHTLKNIIIFNNISIDHNDDSIINLQVYKDGKFISKELKYNEFCDKHIMKIYENIYEK
jgi:hypothetical protein